MGLSLESRRSDFLRRDDIIAMMEYKYNDNPVSSHGTFQKVDAAFPGTSIHSLLTFLSAS